MFYKLLVISSRQEYSIRAVISLPFSKLTELVDQTKFLTIFVKDFMYIPIPRKTKINIDDEPKQIPFYYFVLFLPIFFSLLVVMRK